MKVKNNSKRMICLQTGKGRIDLLPTKAVDDDRLDLVKDEKVFKAMVKAGDLEIVKADDTKSSGSGDKKTKKELLIDEATELGIDTTDMTVAQLETAIKEAKDEGDGL